MKNKMSARDLRADEIQNTVRAVRLRTGMSASQLARSVGLSRQAIYAIEADTYVPNTAVSLRLARALGVAITELFQLPETRSESDRHLLQAIMLPGGEEVGVGRPVQLSRVHGRLIASTPEDHGPYLPLGDALLAGGKSKPGMVAVSVCREKARPGDRLLVAGCDPAMSILARYLRHPEVDPAFVHRNSSESMQLLKDGFVHVAGSHLRKSSGEDANLSTARRLFGPTPIAIISFARWQQCLIVARGNPKRLSGMADLARKGLRFVNRERGSGSRLLVEDQIRAIGLPRSRVRTFDRVAHSHLEAAREVFTGSADCCVAPEAAARLFGLEAIPLAEERYDFVLLRSDLKSPAIERLFNVVSQGKLQHELSEFAGYDMKVAGHRVV